MLDVVEFREEAVGIARAEGGELIAGLFAEIGAVDEEQDAAGAGMPDQALRERAGGVGLARTGCHVDQGARTILSEEFFQASDRLHLAIAHRRGAEALVGAGTTGVHEWVCNRHGDEAGAKRVRLSGPITEGFRPMTGKDPARARLGITDVTEEGFEAGRLVQEWKRASDAGREELLSFVPKIGLVPKPIAPCGVYASG